MHEPILYVFLAMKLTRKSNNNFTTINAVQIKKFVSKISQITPFEKFNLDQYIIFLQNGVILEMLHKGHQAIIILVAMMLLCEVGVKTYCCGFLEDFMSMINFHSVWLRYIVWVLGSVVNIIDDNYIVKPWSDIDVA